MNAKTLFSIITAILMIPELLLIIYVLSKTTLAINMPADPNANLFLIMAYNPLLVLLVVIICAAIIILYIISQMK
jgi:hypothetical protein